MTTTRRRLHRTTFGLGQAQHRAALDVASVIKSVERDRKLSDAPWAAEPRLTRDQPQSSGLRSWPLSVRRKPFSRLATTFKNRRDQVRVAQRSARASRAARRPASTAPSM